MNVHCCRVNWLCLVVDVVGGVVLGERRRLGVKIQVVSVLGFGPQLGSRLEGGVGGALDHGHLLEVEGGGVVPMILKGLCLLLVFGLQLGRVESVLVLVSLCCVLILIDTVLLGTWHLRYEQNRYRNRKIMDRLSDCGPFPY
jgi:hypothetical protein